MDVDVTLHFQTFLDDEREETHHQFTGDYAFDEKGTTLSYTEIIEGVSTVVVIQHKNETVEILRKGPHSTRFVLVEGKTFPCDYATPYGNLSMDVTAETIDNQLTNKGGSMMLSYYLTMGSGKSHHILNLTVKKREKP